jgi:beta-mannanase
LKNARPKFAEFKKYWLKPALATAALGITLGLSLLTSTVTVNHAIASAENNKTEITVYKKAYYGMSTQELVKQIQTAPAQTQQQPTLGMYNSSANIGQNSKGYIQHSFVDWRDDHYFAYTLAQSVQSNNTPLITLEPRGEENGSKLLGDISAGAYDGQLDKIIEVSKASSGTVYIRFAHEMELADLYPWGNQDPQLYTKSYQHVVDRFRNQGANKVKFVWSPAGNNGAGDYYPGDQYVDIIGTTILYDEYWYGGYLPSFASLAQNRQWLETYNKPVWIVEFGAGHANKTNQKFMIDEATSQYKQLGFSALIYLNMVDANIQGPDYHLDSANDFGSFFY